MKLPKPGQERRVDLPTIGPNTIQNVVAANLAGVVVAAQDVLIAERDTVIREADQAGIFIFGRDAGMGLNRG